MLIQIYLLKQYLIMISIRKLDDFNQKPMDTYFFENKITKNRKVSYNTAGDLSVLLKKLISQRYRVKKNYLVLFQLFYHLLPTKYNEILEIRKNEVWHLN